MEKSELAFYAFLIVLGIGLTPIIVQNTTAEHLATVGITGFTASVLQIFPYLFLVAMVTIPLYVIGRKMF